MQTILVTGGAGYIGSVAVRSLIEQDYKVIVIDNLSKGKPELVNEKAILYPIDLADINKLNEVFENNTISAVIHIAAYKSVEESMQDGPKYSDNIKGTINLLNAMVKHNVCKLIYSSSAAVYGMPEKEVIDEETPTNPINYYGFTKLECEKIIEWYANIHHIKFVFLRYFNVAGDVLGYVDPNPQNVLPIIMEAVTGKREKFTIFGEDYNTRDGTCVRDYIHIQDLIDAHIRALSLEKNSIINLGTSMGTSVKELLKAAEEATGKHIRKQTGKRRSGDPACLVATNKRAKELIGWRPRKSIKDIIESTYKAYLNEIRKRD